MVPLVTSSTLEPFWRKLGDVYRYPLGLPGLMVIFVTALLSSIFASSLIFLIIPSLIITHYCFVCLSQTASGDMRIPDFEKAIEGTIKVIFYVYVTIFVAAVSIGIVNALLGSGFAILVSIFYTVTLPAAIMIIAIEENLNSAISPGKLTSIVTATGVSYFVMLLFIIIMLSSLGLLNAILASYENSFFTRFLQASVTNYYSIVVFHIMGYLVYQNQENLGFETPKSRKRAKVRDDGERIEANIEVLIKAGRYERAIDLCKRQIDGGYHNRSWHWQRCFNLMFAASNKRLKRFAEKYFDKLSEQEQGESMAEAYLKIKTRISGYIPEKHAIRLQIAEALSNAGRHKSVVSILDRFHENCQDRKQIISAYKLISDSWKSIPGQEKRATHYQKQLEILGNI